jgi:hypothetical protein
MSECERDIKQMGEHAHDRETQRERARPLASSSGIAKTATWQGGPMLIKAASAACSSTSSPL